ncbi:MAG: type IX secretion system protein PorQ [Bacteroidota bacterium]
MKNKILIVYLLLIATQNSFGQSGGLSAFSFLNFNTSARAAALGGSAIATPSEDVSLMVYNPAQLFATIDKQFSVSYVGYASDISYSDFAYAQKVQHVGMLGAYVHNANYGSFNQTDAAANKIGAFNAAENAIGVVWSKQLDSALNLGVSVKGVFSNLGLGNTSNALAADIGLNYYLAKKNFSAALVVRNFGAQLKKYESNTTERLPLQIQLGIAKKLTNAPFRFSLIGQQMQKFDLSYLNPNQNGIDPLTGEEKVQTITTGNKVMRHVIMNVEVLFSKNFNLRLGYNFLRRNELTLTERKGLSGFSMGLGLKVSALQIAFAKTLYLPYEGSNHITISGNLSDFKKKKKSN